ncbi:rho GTPase-activating protein 36 isoform X2 [Cynoglossus semilaevis]|uniref:rho GTPase-activating protein 36 isoform X2 n=1 Tax=Cynoglossus semilaevis TaxID=244447 RepID=UPI000496E3EE|nr:rho GTPase-activating protein 6-like isoform X2 [Cynoglossus semilaevis]
MLGQSVRLQPVPIQSLSELERARLQEVALYHLEELDLEFKISIPKETQKRRKSLRRKFDSFSREKKEQETAPKAFGIPLSQVIANDHAYKRRQDAVKESRRDCLDLEATILRFRAEKQKMFFNGTKAPGPDSVEPIIDPHHKPLSPTFLDNSGRGHRRGGLSVDSISDLVESQSRLLEALQLSHPAELELKKSLSSGAGSSETRTQTKLSLNPIYRQVPRVVDHCCAHILTYGLQTVGIFRVGSSKKRVRQLRENFDLGVDVRLDLEHSVHDVAALLKEFLRDMPDPLLPRELYAAFLHSHRLRGAEQLHFLQHLLYLLPPCNCDTLLRLLTLLQTVQSFAQDSVGTDGEEIPGNKMTAANLAVIFGPNLLQKERGVGGGGEVTPHSAAGMEDSAAIINVTLMLIQNYRKLFMVSAELQQEVLMSLVQTDPDVINYLLRRKFSNSNQAAEGNSSIAGSRRDTGMSLDSVGTPGSRRDTRTSVDSSGISSGSQSSLDPPSPLFPPDADGGEGGLTCEVFFHVLKQNQSRKRQESGNGDVSQEKSIRHIRQFHSHHNLMSLVSSSCSEQQVAPPLGSSLSGSCSALSCSSSNVWIKQTPQEQNKSPSHFWEFFTGKTSGSETVM